MSQIGCHGKTFAGHLDEIAHVIGAVMRGCEGRNLEVFAEFERRLNVNGAMEISQTRCDGMAPEYSSQGFRSAYHHGFLQFLDKLVHVAHMIGMVMRKAYSAYGRRIDSPAFQFRYYLVGGDTGVNQKSLVVVPDVCTVAAASAAEGYEAEELRTIVNNRHVEIIE